MELNLANIFYLAFRMGPFIIVSYFLLSSLFSQDFKSLIYLAGLILACFVAILFGNFINSYVGFSGQGVAEETPYICNQLTLTGAAPLSRIPLSLVVYSFTLFYLVFAMLSISAPTVNGRVDITKLTAQQANVAAANNIPILVIFPVLILSDFGWSMIWKCSPWWKQVWSIIVGGGMGLAWAYIISSSSLSSLLYLSIMSNAQICARPSKTRFKCKRKMRDVSGNTPPVPPTSGTPPPVPPTAS